MNNGTWKGKINVHYMPGVLHTNPSIPPNNANAVPTQGTAAR